MKWFRKYELTADFHKERKEVWINNKGVEYPMHIKYGKSTDLFGLKNKELKEINKHFSQVSRLCAKFLKDKKKVEKVKNCPLCKLDSGKARNVATIQDVVYYKCPRCDFRFLKERISDKDLEEFYSNDKSLSATLVDPALTKKRIDEVVVPKVAWVLDTFENIYGKKPKKIVDIGAGGGHFVYAAKKLGLDAYGIEPNKISGEYCKKNFDINLDPSNFLECAKEYSDADIVTFFATLEHLPDFMDFLSKARSMFPKKKRGMIIVEVPRWPSLDTAIQTALPNSVVRHLFPLTHIQIFSDNSLANAFIKSGFEPRAGWYFGMDMYELTLQLARILKDDKVVSKLSGILSELQPVIDQGMLSDTMIFAGIPK